LDALAAEDLHALTDGQVLERTATLVALGNRIAAELARTVRRAELAQAAQFDGCQTMAAWLRGHARMSAGAARRVVQAGRVTEALPAVAAGIAAGAISAEQVEVIAPVARTGNLARATALNVDLAATGRVFADTAAAQSYDALRTVVHRYLCWLDPDGPAPDPTESRSLTFTPHDDGSVTGRFHLDAIGGEKLRAAIEALDHAHRPAGDQRSKAQRQADALIQLADLSLAAGSLPTLRGTKPHVAVTIGLADLINPTPGPGTAQTGPGARSTTSCTGPTAAPPPWTT
jgi:hypothetical protein